MSAFEHQALHFDQDKPLVYTAFSKHYFYYRMFISKYVLEQGKVPLNPFMVFDYFLLDTVDRKVIREGNNNLVKRADELWVFGPISDGVLAEIKIAQKMEKLIRYFAIQKPHQIVPLRADEAEFEEDIKQFRPEIL